jgi:hypothetical protein
VVPVQRIARLEQGGSLAAPVPAKAAVQEEARRPKKLTPMEHMREQVGTAKWDDMSKKERIALLHADLSSDGSSDDEATPCPLSLVKAAGISSAAPRVKHQNIVRLAQSSVASCRSPWCW